jgi:hypothetical protein
MANKHGHSGPNHDDRDEQKRKVSGDIHVRGEVLVDLHPDVKTEQRASDKKTDAREENKLRIEWLTFWAVVIYAGLTALQAFLTWQLVTSQHLATRPYVGVKTVEVSHQSWDDVGNVTSTRDRTKSSSHMSLMIEITNFGPIPAEDYTDHTEMKVGSVLLSHPPGRPDTPRVIFPTEVIGIGGGIGNDPDYPNEYTDVVDGKRPLTLEVTWRYKGPDGEHRCESKKEYDPHTSSFLDLGDSCA